MLQISKILKAWLEITDDPPMVVPAYAQPSSVTVNMTDGTAYMEFAAITAELDAIAAGRRYEVRQGYTGVTMLELTPTSTTGTAKDVRKSAAYEIEEQDPENTSAIAFIAPASEKESATPLKIVAPGQATGKNQIAIKFGGKCEVSSNVIGKTIKIRLPIKYPESVLITQEPIESVIAHLVVLWQDDTIKYVNLPSTINLEKRTEGRKGVRQVNLQFQPKLVRVENLV